VLVYVLEASLRLLHPYMPFVTEELWQSLKRRLPSGWQASDSVMVATYPEAETKAIDPEAERVIESVIEVIRSVRNARAEYKVENTRWIEAQIYAGQLTPAITSYSQAIKTLARAQPVTFMAARKEHPASENAIVLVLKEAEVVIPMESVVNLEAERKRLQKEIERSQDEAARLETRLSDSDFLTKAPASVIEKERQKLHTLTDKLERLKQQVLKY
jgi:valyl-tRNA synthetase